MSGTRTIEIPVEHYNFIMALAALMKSQNNQQTNFPLYCIYDKEADESIRWVTCFFTEQGMNKYLEDNGNEFNAPFTRVKSVAYNQELSILMKILVSLDDLVLPEHDNQAYK